MVQTWLYITCILLIGKVTCTTKAPSTIILSISIWSPLGQSYDLQYRAIHPGVLYTFMLFFVFNVHKNDSKSVVKLCFMPLQVFHRQGLLISNTVIRACFLVSSMPRKSAEDPVKSFINENQIKSYMYILKYYCIINLLYLQKILPLRSSWVVNFLGTAQERGTWVNWVYPER